MFAFLGSTVFRMIFGEVINFFKAKQDHKHEQEMIRLNMEVSTHQADLRIAEIKAAADAGVKIIESKAEAADKEFSNTAFLTAMSGIDAPSGIKWIDGFNKLIRPELAQISIVLIACNAIWPDHVILTGLVGEVVCGVLGLFIGGRISSTGR
jgi:hypothetical protein